MGERSGPSANDDPRRPLLADPGNTAAAVRFAELLYGGGSPAAARPWLRRIRRLAPGWGLVHHSCALAARQSGDQARAVRFFMAEVVLDPRAVKGLSRLADDLDAVGQRCAAARVSRWLQPLGNAGPAAELRILTFRLPKADGWDAIGRAIEAISPSAAAEPVTVEALWSAYERLPGAAAAAAAWRQLAERAGGAGGLALAAECVGLGALPTDAAIAAWNARPESDRRALGILALRHAPGLRPLAEAALAGSVAGPDGSVLDSMRSAGMVAVDIGARGLPLGDVPLLPAVAAVVGIDADEAATARLDAAYRAVAGWHDLRPVAAAVGERTERRQLYLTRQPGLASLLPPDPETANLLGLGDAIAVTGTLPVETVPLDAVLRPLGLPHPSHVKLDTQGTELEILRGAEPLVRDQLLSVQVEAEFRPIYRGQALFGDIDRFLVDRGFEAVLLRRSLRRLGTGDREVPSRLELCWCHALYMRSLRDFLARRPDWPAIVRYCTVAMAYRLSDRALLLLGHPAVASAHPAAHSFAEGLRALARQWPDVGGSQGREISKDGW
ncbi:MAG: FkbM family methyltransferase [Thalassobaculum sp.]|uniref:FkbM family methyltransferase n=1 Tax=Thalassobaculum sp. TaxID=2022740 RepID=UPI0032EB19ED